MYCDLSLPKINEFTMEGGYEGLRTAGFPQLFQIDFVGLGLNTLVIWTEIH